MRAATSVSLTPGCYFAGCRASPRRRPAGRAELARNPARGVGHRGDQSCLVPALAEPLDRAAETDRPDGVAAAIEDRRGDPGVADHRLLSFDGVSPLAHLVELGTQCRLAGHGATCQLRQVAAEHLRLTVGVERQKRLAGGTRVEWEDGAHFKDLQTVVRSKNVVD